MLVDPREGLPVFSVEPREGFRAFLVDPREKLRDFSAIQVLARGPGDFRLMKLRDI
jgi:hypothetical protein